MNTMSLKLNPEEVKCSSVGHTQVYTSMGGFGGGEDKDIQLQPQSTHTRL